MATLPESGYLSDLQRTQQEMRDAFEQLRDFTAQLPGGGTISTLTLSDGVVTPTSGWHRVDTEAAASLDALDRISQTNLPEGSILIIEAVDPGRLITVSHLAGGLGEISLVAQTDILLNNRSKLILIRNGTQWEQMYETRIGQGATATMNDYGGSTPPRGAVLCYGQTISWDENPELAAKIGNTFGGTNGVSIGIPDIRDRVTVGKGDMGGTAAERISATYGDTSGLGNTLGSDDTTLSTSNLPNFSLSAGTLLAASHSHGVSDPSHRHSELTGSGAAGAEGGGGSVAYGGNVGTQTGFSSTGVGINNSGTLTVSGSTGSIGSGTAFGVLQPSIVMNKIMWL